MDFTRRSKGAKLFLIIATAIVVFSMLAFTLAPLF